MDDLTVLVLARNHFIYNVIGGGLGFTLGQAKALALQGCNVYVVLPRKEESGYKYVEEKLPNWHESFMPVYVTLVKDHQTGVGVYSKDLLDVLVGRRARIPYDVVLNANTPMGIGMHKPLCEAGYSGVKIPVLNVIDNAASYAEFAKNPIGDREWHKYWEILEALCCISDKATLGNPYDYNLVKRQIKRILSPSLAVKAINNLIFQWIGASPIQPLTLHESPKKGPWIVLLNGGFGTGREELGSQTEAFIDAAKTIYPIWGDKVKFVVCTGTHRSDAVDAMLQGTSEFLKVIRNPPRDQYLKIVERSHIGINLREVNDAIFASWTELMMSGKPTMWLGNKYQKLWVPESMNILSVPNCNGTALAAALMGVMNNYERCAEVAYEWGKDACERHSLEAWGSKIKRTLVMMVHEADEGFNGRKFANYTATFKDFKSDSFANLYKSLNKKANGSFSMYSTAWVLKMMRRFGRKAFVKNGELWIS